VVGRADGPLRAVAVWPRETSEQSVFRREPITSGAASCWWARPWAIGLDCAPRGPPG